MRAGANFKNGVLVAVLLLLPARMALAQTGTWATDAGVGSNSLTVTIQVSCLAPSFTCSLIDGYADTQVSTLSGSGTVAIDAPQGLLQFGSDGQLDWGIGPQPIYKRLLGSTITFVSIPFAGAPQLANAQVFAASNPLIPVPDFQDLGPGDYPFSQSIPYGSLADVVGDMELNVPDIVVAPQSVLLTGTLRMLGDVDFDSFLEYELVNLSAVLRAQQPGNIGGEPVTLSVTAMLTANLSGEVEGPVALPALGGVGMLVLSAGLALIGGRAARRRQVRGPFTGDLADCRGSSRRSESRRKSSRGSNHPV